MSLPMLIPAEGERRKLKSGLFIIAFHSFAIGMNIIISSNVRDFGSLEKLKYFSGEIYLLCLLSIFLLGFSGVNKTKKFLIKYPIISSKTSMGELKALLRNNMYSANLILLFAHIAIPASYMFFLDSMSRDTGLFFLFAVNIFIMVSNSPLESILKQIKVTSNELDEELIKAINSWQCRMLPDF